MENNIEVVSAEKVCSWGTNCDFQTEILEGTEMECGQTSMGMSARACWETLKFSQEIEVLQIEDP